MRGAEKKSDEKRERKENEWLQMKLSPNMERKMGCGEMRGQLNKLCKGLIVNAKSIRAW